VPITKDAILSRCRWWGNRWLLLVGTFMALLALVLAAIDQIAAMIDVGAIALFFFGLSGIVAVYQLLPPGDRATVFTKRFIRRAAVYSLVWASIVASAFWFAGWHVFERVPPWLLWVYPKVDFLPSAFSLVLPVGWRSGFHHYFRSATYCFPGPFWWESMRYLRTAIIAYAGLFFASSCAARLLVFVVRRRRHERLQRT